MLDNLFRLDFKHIERNIYNFVWGDRFYTIGFPKSILIRILRMSHMLIKDIWRGNIFIRANSLVFTTILSMVPLVALSFSILRAFGVHQQEHVKDLIANNILGALGERGLVITERILEFVDNINAGALGGVGILFLFITVMALIFQMEKALNLVWRITQARSFNKRFTGYLSILLVGPLLTSIAIAYIGTWLNSEWVSSFSDSSVFGYVIYLISKSIPSIIIIGVFTFLYVLIPNTQVRPTAAFVGGIIAGCLWSMFGWGFANYIDSQFSTNWTVIYSGFAIIVIFLVWLFIAWCITLIGGAISFYYQNPDYQRSLGEVTYLSNHMREKVALSVMSLIAKKFINGEPPPDMEVIEDLLGLPATLIDDVVGNLVDHGLIYYLDDAPTGYVPAKDVSEITLAEIYHKVREGADYKYYHHERLIAEPVSEMVLDKMTAMFDQELNISLKESLDMAQLTRISIY